MARTFVALLSIACSAHGLSNAHPRSSMLVRAQRRAWASAHYMTMRPKEPLVATKEPQLKMWQALGALNAATLIWGSQHPLIKDVVTTIDSPSALNAARFTIAAVCTLPFCPGAPWRRRHLQVGVENNCDDTVARTWAAGAELGCWSFLGFALQAIGLQTTTASRSAFLLYLNVKLVPVLALLLYGTRSPARTWVSAALAFAGTALLSFDGSPPNIGDAWCVSAALASACFILRLDEAARNEALRAEELNAATLVSSALLCSAWAALELARTADGGASDRAAEIASALLGEDALPLLYLAVVTTAGAQWLQAIGQSRVDARDAAIIYALDPLYAAGFSWLLLGETLGERGLLGGAVVLAAVFVSRTEKHEKDEL
jgi:drug/metabolite transporter (DMT)-like permease